MAAPKLIWIFHASGATFAGGAFADIAMAEFWIGKHKLTGILTAYPLDEGCFDWAVRTSNTGMTEDKLKEKRADSAFIGSFTSASQAHIHFKNGKGINRSPDPAATSPQIEFRFPARCGMP